MKTYALSLILAALQGAPRDSLLREGIRLAPMEPGAALARFEQLLQADSSDGEANWRAAIAASDAALPLTDKTALPARQTLLADAERFARRAVSLLPGDANAHFALGLTLGNRALRTGLRDRIRLAEEIRAAGLRAVERDSTHDGAHHLLGRWNYEVMRLSGFERFVAKNLLGGGVMKAASWEAARSELERAVQLDPGRIYHRLDLARVLSARKDREGAAAELRRIGELPNRVAADTTYRREAAELLLEITRRR